MAQVSATTTAAVIDDAAVRKPVLAMAALGGILALVFWDFFRRQVTFAITEQADWGHTLVIPFMAGYLVYLNRDRLRSVGFRTNWLGLVPIVLGVVWYMFCSFGPPAIRHHNLMGVGVGSTLFGLTLLFCGFRAMLILWFPLAFLMIFGQTISNKLMGAVTFRMQEVTARGAAIAMTISGLDIEQRGNTLTLWSGGKAHPLNVAEACSGMRMLMAFFALGVFMGYTGLPRVWQRIVLVLLAIPTAIFVNVLRVITLALLSLIDVEFAAGDFHTFVGLVWLVPAFMIYLGIMWVLRRLVIEESAAEARPA